MGEAATGIGALVENITSHRFDGYGPARIANEIDKFRSGAGTGSIMAAMDALRAVSTEVAATESTLRAELGKLGLGWQSAAGATAGAAVADGASVANRIAATLDDASQALFAQGDAFNRTRDKLPEAEVVREAIGGTGLGDELMSLIGFETDHAGRVAGAKEATQHAVQVLNEYAVDSGANLGSVEPAAEPKALAFSVAPEAPDAVHAGAGPAAAASGSGADAASARASSAAPAGTAHAAAVVPGGAAPPAAYAAYSHAPDADAPTPPGGLALPGAGSAQQPEGSSGATSVSGVASPTASAGPAPVVGGQSGGAQPTGGISGGSSGGSRALGSLNIAAPGTKAPVSGDVGKPLAPINPGGTGDDAALARGRASGLTSQPATGGGYQGGASLASSRAVASAADLGAGAATIGAGGTAGAMSGEKDRKGRGVGRSAPHAGTSTRQMSFGAGTGDDDAEAARKVEAGAAGAPHEAGGLLEPAAPHEGDDGRVRSRGIDDTDLFSDQRMVAPERIDPGVDTPDVEGPGTDR